MCYPSILPSRRSSKWFRASRDIFINFLFCYYGMRPPRTSKKPSQPLLRWQGVDQVKLQGLCGYSPGEGILLKCPRLAQWGERHWEREKKQGFWSPQPRPLYTRERCEPKSSPATMNTSCDKESNVLLGLTASGFHIKPSYITARAVLYEALMSEDCGSCQQQPIKYFYDTCSANQLSEEKFVCSLGFLIAIKEYDGIHVHHTLFEKWHTLWLSYHTNSESHISLVSFMDKYMPCHSENKFCVSHSNIRGAYKDVLTK